MRLDRRTLLIGGGAGVGLVVAFALWPRHLPSDLGARSGEQTLGNYIKVAKDGRVTVAVPQVETGQGVWTALPQIVADELGAAWEQVAVEPAPLTGHYGNSLAKEEGWPKGIRITAGSTSVRAYERPVREAAAIARAMLIGAAAERWNVAEKECETADGFVLNGNRTFGFGELAEEAAARTPPSRPALRSGDKGRLAGQSLQRLDGPGKSNGSLRFAGDVRLPGMLFAAVRLAPPGGRLTGFSREAARAIPGVRHVAARDRWLALVADNGWAAEQALKAADAKFTGERTAPEMRALFDDAIASGQPRKWFERGDYAGIVKGSHPLAAAYFVAPSQHLGLEPVSATARVNGGQLELWAAALAPELARDSAGAGATLYPLPAGEPAGRAMEPDAVPVAVELARELNGPVQVTLSHGSSQNHDRVAPGALVRLNALPGQGGITAAWYARIATADGLGSALARLKGKAPPDEIGRGGLDGSVPPYAIPHVRIESVAPSLPFTPGYMRGSPQRELTFANESFVDELAHAAGVEPLAFRMSMLGGNPRLARCLQIAARLAQWDGGGRGSNMGIAGCSAFGSHIALVATVSVGDDQRVKVHKLVATVDCGRAVNPGMVTQQVEAGLIWALAQASVPAPEWVAAMPRARGLGALGLPRIGDVPDMVVQLLPGDGPPGGVSGLGPAVLAPAAANAVYAGTGRRLRSLPFDLAAA